MMKKHYKVYNTFICIVLLSASFMAQAMSDNTPNTKPLIFIHGFLGEFQSWTYWSKFKKLIKAEYPNEYHEEGDLFEHQWSSWRGISTYEIDRLDSAIDTYIKLGNSTKADIVAHSFGGLLIRKYIEVKGASKIGRVVTIGTPHLGTEIAEIVRLCDMDLPGNEPSCSGVVSSGAIQMDPFGSFVNDLNNNLPSYAIRSKFMSIRSGKDEIVPWEQSVLFGSTYFNTATCSNINSNLTNVVPLYHMGQINEPLTVDYTRKFLKNGSRSDYPIPSKKWNNHLIACAQGITLREAALINIPDF
jgi:pimeloyl-ACP methyl ester carboxylesterase